MARHDLGGAPAILQRSRDEARTVGSRSVEAEHVLLAIAAHKGTVAQHLLADVGLDHAAILAALEREFEESLAGVGVSLSDFDLPPAPRRPEATPQWGTSFKLALQRTRTRAGGPGGRLDATNLLLGILRAPVGTVPRTLALAGVDRTALLARAQAAETARQRP